MAELHCAEAENPSEGSTVPVTGIPGAGKTSLLRRLRKEWSDPEGTGPFGVVVDRTALEHPDALATAVRKCIGGGSGPRLGGLLWSISIGAFGFDIGVETAPTEPGVSGKERPVALFIDEIQNISRDSSAPESKVLE